MSTEITDSTVGQEVFREGDYWLADDGKVYRGEVLLGTLDEASYKVTYAPDMQRYQNRVGRLINAYVAVQEEAVEAIGERVVDSLEAKGEEVMGDYPEGAPECDWRGDLTPEFIAWYFEKFPKRAKLRYEARRRLPALAAFFNS